MGFLQLTTAAMALLATSASAAKVTDPNTGITYNEAAYTQAKISYRIAIPDTATAAPFDVLFSIVAPINVGWAGFAWGGQMVNNPLTLAWANGANTLVSSRWAASKSSPTPYTGASYTVLPGSKTNTTHWQLDVLCKGCSSWTAGGQTVRLNPAATNQKLAAAYSASKPTTPASNTSAIMRHTGTTSFNFDLAAAKLPNFATLLAAYQNKTGTI